MGTVVLHPQDCLAPLPGHPNRRFPMASEYTSAMMAKSFSVCHGVALDCVGNTDVRGVLGRKDSSAGLLPLPDHAPRSTHASLCRSAAEFASLKGRGSSRGSLPNLQKRCRFPASSYEPAAPSQRCSTPYHDLAPHGRRRLACGDLDAVPARVHMNSGPAEVSARPPIAPMAKTHLFQSYDSALSKWTEQHKVMLLSEATHLDPHLPRRGAKQSIKDATCKSSTTFPRRHGGIRLLNRSMSEKISEQIGVTALPKKGVTNASLVQVPLSTCPEERNLKILPPHLASVARSSSVTWSPDVNRAETFVARKPSHMLVSYESSTSGVRGQEGVSDGHVNPSVRSTRKFRADDVMDCLDPASDTSSWLSLMDERWAGPSCLNSPPPSALPIPSFTSKLSRTTLTSPEPMNGASCGSPLFVDCPVPEVKRTWDVAFATKDLRRLLQLDHAPGCDA